MINHSKSKFKLNNTAQGMIEYILLFAVVIIIIIAALQPNGLLTNSVNQVIDDATQEVQDMAVCINYCGDGPCPAVARNGCCEAGEEDPVNPVYDPVDCGGCVPVGCLLGDCRFKSDGCNGTVDCGPCPCVNQSESTLCGSVTFNGGPSGTVRTLACPSGCVNTVQGVCTDGTWSVNDNCIETPCGAYNGISTPCGTVSLPASSSGSSPSVGCPSGCTGAVSATCTRGVWGPVTNSCVPSTCPAQSVSVGACSGSSTLPGGTLVNTSASVACPGACSGSVSGLCSASGSWTSIDSSSCCLPVAGGWSAPTTVLSSCSGGFQSQTVTRACNNPVLSCGGANCTCAVGASSCTGNPRVETTVTSISCCGNNSCDPGETCGTCPGDCGVCPSGTGCASCPAGFSLVYTVNFYGFTYYYACNGLPGLTGEYFSGGNWCSDLFCTGTTLYLGAVCRISSGFANTNYTWRFR